MPSIYVPPRNTNSGSSVINLSGSYVTIGTAQSIYGSKTFFANVIVASSGIFSLTELNPSTSGNMMTWDGTGQIVDSKIPVNEFDSYSTTTSLSAFNETVNYTGSGGNVFILPPAASNSPKAVKITIKHSGSGNLNVAPYGGEILDALAPSQSILMVPGQALTFISNAINNYIIT